MKSTKMRVLLTGCALAAFMVTTLGVADEKEQVIRITAKRFEFLPKEIAIKRGMPVVLEFGSLDRLHGFNCTGLGIRTDVEPKKASRVSFVPQKIGAFPFHCDNFCGSGHEGMRGTITVTE